MAGVMVFYFVLLVPLAVLYPEKTGMLRALICRLRQGQYVDDRDVVFQKQFGLCGTACIQMLLNRHFIDFQHADLYCLGWNLSMFSISDTLRKYGFDTRGIRFHEKTDILRIINDNDSMDLIVHLQYKWVLFFSKDSHWAIIDAICLNDIILLDPFLGRVLMNNQRFFCLWSGYALLARYRGISE